MTYTVTYRSPGLSVVQQSSELFIESGGSWPMPPEFSTGTFPPSGTTLTAPGSTATAVPTLYEYTAPLNLAFNRGDTIAFEIVIEPPVVANYWMGFVVAPKGIPRKIAHCNPYNRWVPYYTSRMACCPKPHCLVEFLVTTEDVTDPVVGTKVRLELTSAETRTMWPDAFVWDLQAADEYSVDENNLVTLEGVRTLVGGYCTVRNVPVVIPLKLTGPG